MSAPGRPQRRVEERFGRLLVMLPWLMTQREVPLAEVARRFRLSEAEVVADLELASMCGLPPFVDELIDLFIDEGVVHVGVPRLFTRPLRLTAPEGFALLTAGRAAMRLPGADLHGPLGRALAKLAALLGDDGVVVELPESPLAAALADGATSGATFEIDYRSASSEQLTTRTIAPRVVFAEQGEWYVVADDDRSGEQRTFRLDRIERWSPTGARVEPAPIDAPPAGSWFGDPDIARVTVRLRPPARWVAERYPVDDAADDGDDLVVRMPVASTIWLARLLLRLGPAAEIVEPVELADLAADEAQRVLENYAS
jgi:proteasome accessory factor C